MKTKRHPKKRPATAPGRVMWLSSATEDDAASTRLWHRKHYPHMGINTPVLVLPVADVEALVEGVARAIAGEALARHWVYLPKELTDKLREDARAVLRHLGMPL